MEALSQGRGTEQLRTRFYSALVHLRKSASSAQHSKEAALNLEWKISSSALSWGSWTESWFIALATVPESHLEMFRLSLLPAAKACVGKRKNPAPDLKDQVKSVILKSTELQSQEESLLLKLGFASLQLKSLNCVPGS